MLVIYVISYMLKFKFKNTKLQNTRQKLYSTVIKNKYYMNYIKSFYITNHTLLYKFNFDNL